MRKNTGEWLTKTFDSEETSAADRLLAVAAIIVEEMRAAVFEQTGFRCSAGIAHNKVSAASQGFSGFLLPIKDWAFSEHCNSCRTWFEAWLVRF